MTCDNDAYGVEKICSGEPSLLSSRRTDASLRPGMKLSKIDAGLASAMICNDVK
jgi:hypothetical protein